MFRNVATSVIVVTNSSTLMVDSNLVFYTDHSNSFSTNSIDSQPVRLYTLEKWFPNFFRARRNI